MFRNFTLRSPTQSTTGQDIKHILIVCVENVHLNPSPFLVLRKTGEMFVYRPAHNEARSKS